MKFHELDNNFLAALHLGLERYLTCRSNTNKIDLMSLDPEVVERALDCSMKEYEFNGDPKAPLNYVLSQILHMTSRTNPLEANVIGQLMTMSYKSDALATVGVESVYMPRITAAASTVVKILIGEPKEAMRADLIAELTIRILMSCALNNTPDTSTRFSRPLLKFELPVYLSNQILEAAMERIAKLEALFLEE